MEKLHLLCQSVHQCHCSAFRHSCSKNHLIPPRYLNFSTCCSVLPLSYVVHSLGSVKRHNTSACWFSIRVGCTKQIPEHVHVEGHVQKMVSSTKLSGKTKLSTAAPFPTQLQLSDKMKRNGESTHPFWIPRPTSNGCDLADTNKHGRNTMIMASNRWSSSPYRLLH